MANTCDGRPQRAKSNGVSLTAKDASIVKARLLRGDRQSDIAADFRVNGGRISEINTGKTFPAVLPAPANSLN
jgi:hypothetical protein